MSEKYIDLYETISDDMFIRPDEVSVSRGVLEWLDDHPDQVPRPRMTYSELAEEVKSVERVEKRFEAVAYVLTNLGFTICSDPEPTNAEKLDKIMEEWPGRATASDPTFGEYLHNRGVKAPGGDDDH